MTPQILKLVNAPKIKRRRKSTTTTTTNQAAKARRARARRRPNAPTKNGDSPMASKRRKKSSTTTTGTKRSSRRKRSASTSRRYSSTPPTAKRRRRRGGGGGGSRGGFLAKFMPANGLMIAAGGAGAMLGAGYVVDFVAGYLPDSITTSSFFQPAAWMFVGGLGYWGLRKWNSGVALGFFVGAAAKAVYSIAQPYISDFVNRNLGLVSGGGYTPPAALPGENERVALAAQQQQYRLTGMGNFDQSFFKQGPSVKQNNPLRLVA